MSQLTILRCYCARAIVAFMFVIQFEENVFAQSLEPVGFWLRKGECGEVLTFSEIYIGPPFCGIYEQEQPVFGCDDLMINYGSRSNSCYDTSSYFNFITSTAPSNFLGYRVKINPTPSGQSVFDYNPYLNPSSYPFRFKIDNVSSADFGITLYYVRDVNMNGIEDSLDVEDQISCPMVLNFISPDDLPLLKDYNTVKYTCTNEELCFPLIDYVNEDSIDQLPQYLNNTLQYEVNGEPVEPVYYNLLGQNIYNYVFCYQFDEAGEYSVTLALSDSSKASCTGRILSEIKVVVDSKANFNFEHDCSNDSIYFFDKSPCDSAISWLWIFGDGDSAFVRNPVHKYDQPGVYQVTLTINGNSSTAKTKGVSTDPFHWIYFDPIQSTTCSGRIDIEIENWQDNLKYTFWADGGFYHQSGGNAPRAVMTFSEILNDRYLSATVYNDRGCSRTDSFYLQGCCHKDFTPGRYTFQDERATNVFFKFLDIANAPTNVITTQDTILIDGTFIIDRTTVFDNCPNIIFSPNAQIIFEDGGELYINKSHLRACSNTMWDGIINNQPNTLLVVDSSTIEDATVGIAATLPASFQVTSTTFDNNNIGITVVSLVSDTFTGVVEGCQFKCTSPTGLKAPFDGKKTSSGIIAYNVNGWKIPLGGDNAQPNFFKGINNGITAYMCNLTVKQNYFEDIQPFQPPVQSIGNMLGENAAHGTGVYIYDHQANQRLVWVKPFNDIPLNDTIYKPNFKSCNTGIFVNGANVRLYNNYMDSTQRGINVINCRGKLASISGNRINHTRQGISSTQNPASNVAIDFNIISVNNQFQQFSFGVYNAAYGISVDDYFGLNNTAITRNRIYGGRNGIQLSNTGHETFVQHNHITLDTFTNFGVQTGIVVENSEEVYVTNNTVYGSGGVYSTTKRQRGIELKRSHDYYLKCNTTANIGYGIVFRGNCQTEPDRITENTTMNNRYGWRFERLTFDAGNIGASIGSEVYISKNIFLPPFNNPDEYRTYNYTYSGASNSMEYFYKSGQQYYPTTNGSNISSLELRPEESPLSNPTVANECDSTQGNPGIILNPLDQYNYEELVAEGEVYYPEFSEMLTILDEASLYEELNEHSDMVLRSAILQTFYQMATNSVYAQVYDYELGLRNLQEEDIFGDTLAFADYMADLSDYSNFSVDANKWSGNLSDIADIYNHFLSSGPDSLSFAEVSLLETLAYSCPYEEGDAVWLARSLYRMYADTVYFEDKEICQMYGLYKTDETFEDEDVYYQTKTPEFNFNYTASLYPNPASDIVRLVYQFDKNELGTALITDVAGRTVGSLKLPANNDMVHFNVSALLPGTYHCKVVSSQGFSEHIKFMVIK